jgi:hypothetical protein
MEVLAASAKARATRAMSFRMVVSFDFQIDPVSTSGIMSDQAIRLCDLCHICHWAAEEAGPINSPFAAKGPRIKLSKSASVGFSVPDRCSRQRLPLILNGKSGRASADSVNIRL